MNVWIPGQNTFAEKLIRYQEQFCHHGGKVTRVLCGRGEKPDSDTVAAYQAMKSAGITVKYYDISKNLVDHEFVWDFLRIRETGDVVIWNSFSRGPGRIIGQAVYTRSSIHDDKELDKLWNEIIQYSVDFSAVAPNVMRQAEPIPVAPSGNSS
jgi:hypothetical protein